jgi:hypothetical protein
MSEKAKRTLGMICLIFSGLLLIGEVSVSVIPAMAEMANRTLGDHLRSLVMVFVIGAVGLHLRRARAGESTVFVLRLIVFALLLTPLLDIQVAFEVMREYGPIALLPNVRIALILLSLILIVVPYILGRRIIDYQSKRASRSSATPHFALYIIGLACAVLPSTLAAFSVFVGLSRTDIYYFVALSYLAALVWSARSYYRRSGPVKRDFTET